MLYKAFPSCGECGLLVFTVHRLLILVVFLVVGHFSWHTLFIYLSMAVLGLCCCMQFFLVVTSRELFFVAIRGLLIAVASIAVKHGP